ncbi:MAG: PhoX family phosphatase [Cyanobacteriota bacterium]|nr:PhoX family phosphatase [Cyanobacteriota bacterium]
MSKLTRRQLLIFFGSSAAATVLAPKIDSKLFGSNPEIARAQASMTFTPVKLASPVPAYKTMTSYVPLGIEQGSLLAASQDLNLSQYAYLDDVVVPPEYERYVIVRWGDRVFPDREEYFGYNCDYTGFVPINGNINDGYLWVNHEYVSYPISIVAPGTSEDLAGLPTTDRLVLGLDLSQKNRFTLGEFLYNVGGSVVRIGKGADGRYTPAAGDRLNRRIHGLSGLGINSQRSDGYQSVTSWGASNYQRGDNNYLEGTGPAAREVFSLSSDGLGDRIIGTAYNCSGGTTPWGTILTAEENFQGSEAFFVGVQEAVLPNGTQTGYVEGTTGAEFGLVGEKYGWMVEIDPADPNFRPKKHTALGRFRHENITFRVSAGSPLVAYMGDDRRGGHTYKYVSNGTVSNPTDKNNSQLFEDGTLYVAQFDRNKTGRWIPLLRTTPTNPNVPSQIAEAELNTLGEAQRDGRVRLPKRNGIAGETEDGGSFVLDLTNQQSALGDYENKSLADFYTSQGAVLTDAFLASNLIGGTPTARPEDLEVSPITGEVFIAYTDSAPGGDGYPDSRIFAVAKYFEAADAIQQFGGLYKIMEDTPDGTSNTFRWERFAKGGEAGSDEGSGFANVDNLAFDSQANVWGVTDMSTSRQNGFRTGRNPEPREIDHSETGSADALVGVFGNNWVFFSPSTGGNAGEIIPFAYGPPRCEITGPTFISDGFRDDTLILAVQHPGEDVPLGNEVELARSIEMLDLDGNLFEQTRIVPRGSNWPSNIEGNPDGACRPSVIGVRRRQPLPNGQFV